MTRKSRKSTWTRRPSRKRCTAPVDRRQHDVVQRPAEAFPDCLHVVQVHREPVEAAVRTDRLVERRVRDRAQARAQHAARRAPHGADVRARVADVGQHAAGSPRRSRTGVRARRAVSARQHLPPRRPGPRHPARRRLDVRRRLGRAAAPPAGRRSTCRRPCNGGSCSCIAKRSPPSRPSTTQISQSGFERSSCCDMIAAREPLQLIARRPDAAGWCDARGTRC